MSNENEAMYKVFEERFTSLEKLFEEKLSSLQKRFEEYMRSDKSVSTRLQVHETDYHNFKLTYQTENERHRNNIQRIFERIENVEKKQGVDQKDIEEVVNFKNQLYSNWKLLVGVYGFLSSVQVSTIVALVNFLFS